MNPTASGFLLIGIGAVVMLGAAFNWWIVSRPRRLFNMLLGDTMAPVIYFVIGIFLFIRGMGLLLGKNWL
jgi:hypothetical protein